MNLLLKGEILPLPSSWPGRKESAWCPIFFAGFLGPKFTEKLVSQLEMIRIKMLMFTTIMLQN